MSPATRPAARRPLGQVGGGGLAGRSRDADHAQSFGGTAVDDRGGLAEHRARRGMHQHGDVQGAREEVCARRVGEHGDRARGDRVGRETRAVCTRARQRREQITRLRVLTAQRHAGDVHRGEVGRRACRVLGGDRSDRGSQWCEVMADGTAGTQLHGHATVPIGDLGRPEAGAVRWPAMSTADRDQARAERCAAATATTRSRGTTAPPRSPAIRRPRAAARPS